LTPSHRFPATSFHYHLSLFISITIQSEVLTTSVSSYHLSRRLSYCFPSISFSTSSLLLFTQVSIPMTIPAIPAPSMIPKYPRSQYQHQVTCHQFVIHLDIISSYHILISFPNPSQMSWYQQRYPQFQHQRHLLHHYSIKQ
jgi:hypothetical protein